MQPLKIETVPIKNEPMDEGVDVTTDCDFMKRRREIGFSPDTIECPGLHNVEACLDLYLANTYFLNKEKNKSWSTLWENFT